MRFRKIRIELQRALASFPRFLPITGDWILVENEERKAVGVAGPGEGEIRVQIERPTKHLARKSNVDLVKATDELSSSQIIIVGGHIAARSRLEGRPLQRRDRFEQRLGDTFRDLVLDHEDVFQLSVETLAPEMRATRNGHQLSRDTQVIVGLANAALEHRFDPELSADSSHVSAAFLKFKRRRSSDHPELPDIGEGVEDLFRHAFAKIPLVTLRAHVDKWQDGNGGTIAVLGGMTGQFRGNANSMAGEIKKPGENYDDGKAER